MDSTASQKRTEGQRRQVGVDLDGLLAHHRLEHDRMSSDDLLQAGYLVLAAGGRARRCGAQRESPIALGARLDPRVAV